MALKDLRILRLEAENVKRIKVVEITPKGDIVTITGKNGHGKTSVLDCILWALGGTADIQWKPVREGEAGAHIQLDLGNDEGLQLEVVRRFIKKEDGSYTTSLKVVTADGMRPQGEQTLLSALVGALSFDPGEFVRAKPADQVKLLKSLIPDADFDAIAKERKKAFDERTEANREEKRLRATGEAIAIEEDLPDLVDVEAIADRLSAIGTAIRAHEEELRSRRLIRDSADAAYTKRDEAKRRAEALREEAAELDDVATEANARGVKLEEEWAALPALVDPEDPADVRNELAEAQALARRHERQDERVGLLTQADTVKASADALSARIERLDADVVDLIKGADLPVSGLALQDDVVFLRGVPFDQASDAEQLRAALALGIAANPKLRVIRIRDGGLFDDDAMQVIREVAQEENFQIWLESVRGFGDPEEIVMENGEVK